MKRNTLLRVTVCWLALGMISSITPVSNASENTGSAEPNPPTRTTKKQVSRIVFIGQKQSCDCTRKRIAASWKALEAANAASRKVPVKRIDWDVDEKEAETYVQLRSLMVIPGIYFLDEKGKLVEMLQGEVTEKQVADALK